MPLTSCSTVNSAISAPAKGIAAYSEAIGVKVVTDVDKSGFTAVADPYLDKLAKELGPHADKVKTLIRSIN